MAKKTSHHVQKCAECGREMQIAGRGLCGKCYGRIRRAELASGKKPGRQSRKPLALSKGLTQKSMKALEGDPMMTGKFFFLSPEGQDPYTATELASMDLTGYQVIQGRPVKVSVEIKINNIL